MTGRCKRLHNGPLFNRDGSIAVCPHPRLAPLRRALERGLGWRAKWSRVVQLRRRGEDARADRLVARRLLGVKRPSRPMPAEVRAMFAAKRRGRRSA